MRQLSDFSHTNLDNMYIIITNVVHRKIKLKYTRNSHTSKTGQFITHLFFNIYQPEVRDL